MKSIGWAWHQVSAMIPATRSASTRALSDALHSLSTIVPPVGRAMFEAFCQPDAPRLYCVRLVPTATRDPCGSAENRQPALVQHANAWALPSHAPTGEAPTNQHCPGVGVAGGVLTSAASATGNRSASTLVSASLCVISFCACPAASNGSFKRSLVNASAIINPYSIAKLLCCH